MAAKNHFPVMENMTIKQIDAYLGRKKSIIAPIGVMEQHGYHLPVCTDALVATHLGRRIGERTDTIVAPTIHQSFSGGWWPGTINVTPAVMALVVSDILSALAATGFRNLYLLLCHGGSENARALDHAIKMLLRLNPAFENVMVALLPFWEFSSPGIGWSKAIEEGDWHAGWLETSIVMALRPDLVNMEEMELDPEPILNSQIEHPDNYLRAEKIVDDEHVIPRLTPRPEVKIGVMGRPERASREEGERIVDDLVKNISAKITKLDERADGIYKEVDYTPEPLLLKKKRRPTGHL